MKPSPFRTTAKPTLLPIIAILTGWLLIPASLLADSYTDAYRIVRGARLYDNWGVLLQTKPPKENHPAYPKEGKAKGMDTWRCKECHGWDGKGKDGAYGKGKHATGIPGILAWQGKDPAQVATILRNPTHSYTPKQLSDGDIQDLALFVTRGQIDMATVIDPETGKAKGDANRGGPHFQTICATCHGLTGQELNFGTPDKPEHLGAASRENPWEALFKIRFGQPKLKEDRMVALFSLPIDILTDILAHTQTLPE
ncbi:MAG: hypothetical protein HQL91_09330 [Magnetococcales bacterium]|nr:hypothetical protein [Magnetococcales bacterium]